MGGGVMVMADTVDCLAATPAARQANHIHAASFNPASMHASEGQVSQHFRAFATRIP